MEGVLCLQNNKSRLLGLFLRRKHYTLITMLALAMVIMLSPLLFACRNTSAVSIDSGIYSTAIYTKNFENQKTIYSLGPLNTSGNGSFYVFNENNPTGIWDYTQALSFANPYSNKTGTGYVSSLYFTMHSTNGNFLNEQITSLLANINLGFEGLSEDLPYCSKSYEVRVQDSSTVQFLLRGSCPFGSYPEGTVFSQVESLVDYSPDSIFWCANDNPSRQCASNVGVTLYNIDYYFSLITTKEDSYNQTIINQNETIINQNQTIIDQDNQDRHDLQDQTDDSSDTADDLSGDVSNASSSLLLIIGNFVNIVLNPPQSDCNITLDVGNANFGQADLCRLSLPQPLAVIGTLFIIGFIITFTVSLIMTFLSLLKGATQ